MTDITAGHFLIGTVGLAVLRHWYVDGDANEQRITELRGILDRLDEAPFDWRLNPDERSLADGYAEWAEFYDGSNPLIEIEQPIVEALTGPLGGPGVRALDAACGTGRHAAHLAAAGCDVDGVDASEAMLAVAEANVGEARFGVGDLIDLPFDDDTFDLAVCALALTHLADPTPAIVEIGRVVRPAGTVIITDPHPAVGKVGGQAFYGGFGPDRTMTFVRNHQHYASTYLRAFASAGLTVADVEEVVPEPSYIEATSPAAILYPEAALAASGGLPVCWIWKLVRQSR